MGLFLLKVEGRERILKISGAGPQGELVVPPKTTDVGLEEADLISWRIQSLKKR